MKILKNGILNKVPDAILLDLDNTLYSYQPSHEVAMNAVCEKIMRTFSINKEQFNSAFSQARIDVKNRLHGLASSHSRLLYFQRMLEIIGLGSQVLLALDFEQTYWRTFLNKIVLFDGVKELLDDIRLSGIPTAIVTDLTSQIQFRKVVYLGLDHYFDYMVTSEEAGYDKPHPAPFELAISKLNADAQCIWMIGDNAEADIKGARKSINAVTIQKVHTGVEVGVDDCSPDCVVYEFNELRKILQIVLSKSEEKCRLQDQEISIETA